MSLRLKDCAFTCSVVVVSVFAYLMRYLFSIRNDRINISSLIRVRIAKITRQDRFVLLVEIYATRNNRFVYATRNNRFWKW